MFKDQSKTRFKLSALRHSPANKRYLGGGFDSLSLIYRQAPEATRPKGKEILSPLNKF